MRILYPLDYLPTINEAQSAVIDRFVEGLEATFNVKRTEISLAEQWKTDLPDGPKHDDIAKYLELVRSVNVGYTECLTMDRPEDTPTTVIHT